jgi:hypothetical protein
LIFVLLCLTVNRKSEIIVNIKDSDDSRFLPHDLFIQGNLMNSLKRLHKQISALYDAEFEARDVEFAIAKLGGAKERAVWSVYQKIGDVLRADLARSSLSKGFDERMSARLATEPSALPPSNGVRRKRQSETIH